MNNITLLSIVILLGVVIIISYIPVVRSQIKNNNLWFGIDGSARNYFYFCMLLSVVGFGLFFIPLFKNIDTESYQENQIGLFKNKNVLPALLITLLLSSFLWSFFILHAEKKLFAVLSSFSLVLTALCTILLIAGTVEVKSMDTTTTIMMVGLVLFSITTVLNDGIIYNAKMLKKIFK